MFVLDTSVLSALMSPKLEPRVAAWVSGQPVTALYTVAVCKAEILSGIAVLPPSRRRAALQAAAEAVFSEDFEDRVLPFDSEAATIYAELLTARRRAGRPIATIDIIVASVARLRGASVVTRDTAGFEGCDLTLINPWEAS